MASLEQSKRQASSNNGQDVQLRALERDAKAKRDQLESFGAKYRDASARENLEATPTDGRIISRASVSNTPAYPKKLPIVLVHRDAGDLAAHFGRHRDRRALAHDRPAETRYGFARI